MIGRTTIIELWDQREHPNGALALLIAISEYLKANEPLPPLLALWHSRAIERASKAVPSGRGERIEHARATAYTRALGIARSDNRPMMFVSRRFVAMTILAMSDTYCEATVCKRVQAEFGVSPNTARARIREATRIIDEGRGMLQRSKVAHNVLRTT